MRRSPLALRTLLVASLLAVPGAASAGDLTEFLGQVDVRAGADLGSFKTDLSLTFGVSSGKVDGLFTIMSKPSDVYMCLRVGELSRQPVDRVVAAYEQHRGQGWGVIAKELGIKPGSDEFHALKAGRLPAHGGGAADRRGKPGKGRR